MTVKEIKKKVSKGRAWTTTVDSCSTIKMQETRNQIKDQTSDTRENISVY